MPLFLYIQVPENHVCVKCLRGGSTSQNVGSGRFHERQIVKSSY